MNTKLTWHEVSDNEWQSGGLSSGYTIRRTPGVAKATFSGDHYTVLRREPEGQDKYLSSWTTLDKAKAAAHTHVNG